jgi:hypothetical protein
MNGPTFPLIDAIRSRLFRIAQSRKPDVVIGGHDDPYLYRWWVIPRNRFFNVYLHCFMRSDDDRAHHSHPWLFNFSWLLCNHYQEHTPNGVVLREQGAMKLRWGAAWHRIELVNGPCWTLFITGPHVRQWGFQCPQGFVHWRQFTAPHDAGQIGRGCE